MFELLAAAAIHNRLWFAIPLIVSVSLVYGATRHELIGPILNNALRAGVWILSFMSIIFGILFVISWAI